jgi:hypothetical protein
MDRPRDSRPPRRNETMRRLRGCVVRMAVELDSMNRRCGEKHTFSTAFGARHTCSQTRAPRARSIRYRVCEIVSDASQPSFLAAHPPMHSSPWTDSPPNCSLHACLLFSFPPPRLPLSMVSMSANRFVRSSQRRSFTQRAQKFFCADSDLARAIA